MEHHADHVKFLMSEERKQQHNPETILKEAEIMEGMITADLGSGPGFFTIPMAQMTGEKGLVYAVDSNQLMLNGLIENIAKSEVNQNTIKIVNSDFSFIIMSNIKLLKEQKEFGKTCYRARIRLFLGLCSTSANPKASSIGGT